MKKLNQTGFHILYVVIFIFIIAAIGFVGWRVFSKQKILNVDNKSNYQVNRSDPFIQQYGTNCEDTPDVSFTHSPITPDQLGFIEPMGKMMEGYVTPIDRISITPLNPSAADNSYNVVMPAGGKIVSIQATPSRTADNKDVTLAPESHRLIIAHNCRYFSIFARIQQLNDKIKQEAGPLELNTVKQVAIKLKAGEPIGKIGGNPVDWTLVDAGSTLAGIITPKLYEKEPWKIHVIDPLGVYSGSLREQLESKSLRNQKPVGGKIDHDKRGALIGNWFRLGSHGYAGTVSESYWEGHLSIVPDYIDPAATIVSLGNWQGSTAQFAVKGTVDPSQITKQNSPVKYELVGYSYLTPLGAVWTSRQGFVAGLQVGPQGAVVGTIMLEVQDNNKLRVEKFPGKTAGQVDALTPAAEIYER